MNSSTTPMGAMQDLMCDLMTWRSQGLLADAALAALHERAERLLGRRIVVAGLEMEMQRERVIDAVEDAMEECS